MKPAIQTGAAQRLPHSDVPVTFPVAANVAPLPLVTALPEAKTAFRCYRYALRLTPMQSQALARASDQARRVWNELCALLIWAENEQRFGRREALLHAYGKLLDQKKRAGKAIAKAHRLMEQHQLPNLDTAYAFAHNERVEDVRRRLTPCQFAVEYALERMQFNARHKRLGFSAQTALAVAQKFETAARLFATGKRQRPRYKVQGDPVTLQRQIGHGTASPVDFRAGTVDLSTVLGSPCARAVRAVLHRPLPPGGQIKQIAIALTPTRAYAVCMVEAPVAVFVKTVPEASPTAVAGIDPGRTTALSVSSLDGKTVFTVLPPLFRNARFLRKLRRLQRRADRQLHAANPGCRNKKGRWTKRIDKLVRSASYRRTRQRVAEGLRHLAAARREEYHLAANRLVAGYALIGVGHWRGRGKAGGVGGWRRSMNRRDHDNALAEFADLLKDKAARCSRRCQVVDVHEAFTTRRCFDCGGNTGPRGWRGLKVREWTCAGCGAHHQRDFASARAIARQAVVEAAAGARPAQPEPRKRGSNSAAPSTRKRPRKARMRPSPKTGKKARLVRAEYPSVPKRASERARRSGASAALPPSECEAVGVGWITPAPCSQPPNCSRQQTLLPLSEVPRALQDAGREDASALSPAPSNPSRVTGRTPFRLRRTPISTPPHGSTRRADQPSTSHQQTWFDDL